MGKKGRVLPFARPTPREGAEHAVGAASAAGPVSLNPVVTSPANDGSVRPPATPLPRRVPGESRPMPGNQRRGGAMPGSARRVPAPAGPRPVPAAWAAQPDPDRVIEAAEPGARTRFPGQAADRAARAARARRTSGRTGRGSRMCRPSGRPPDPRRQRRRTSGRTGRGSARPSGRPADPRDPGLAPRSGGGPPVPREPGPVRRPGGGPPVPREPGPARRPGGGPADSRTPGPVPRSSGGPADPQSPRPLPRLPPRGRRWRAPHCSFTWRGARPGGA